MSYDNTIIRHMLSIPNTVHLMIIMPYHLLLTVTNHGIGQIEKYAAQQQKIFFGQIGKSAGSDMIQKHQFWK